MTVSLSPPPALTGVGLFVGRSNAQHLLGLEGLSALELRDLIADAAREREWLRRSEPSRNDLAGCNVLLTFIEDSTRTRTSFELAAKRLGASVTTFSVGHSSMNKGESLLDTLRLFEAMRGDVIIIRHSASGAPHYLARHLGTSIVNAGDGMHEHPTQGLLDLLTLSDAWDGRFEGRRIAILGDIAHSRVARSAIFGLTTLGAEVTVAGPATLMPMDIELLGCSVAPTAEVAMRGADAVMALRLQLERMERGLLPSVNEYAHEWGVTPARVKLLAPGAPVLHPGPVNRGVELSPEVADGPRSKILAQVENGVAVRAAVLKRCWRARSARHGFTAEVA